MKTITILGATGSIGVSTLDIISHHRDEYSVFALTCHNKIEKLLEQCQQFEPKHVVIVDEKAARQFRSQMAAHKINCEVHIGAEALSFVAEHSEVDYVMAAIVGAAGLLPTLAAARAGKRVLLANKEALVITGQLFMNAIAESGAELLPIDSEHNALYQSLPFQPLGKSLTEIGVNRLILTASGGPFRTFTAEQLIGVTPEQAMAHPNWKMGQKISVDSATMMNKGLEVIEARWLFNAPLKQIDVVIHPQSVIHSMVEYKDGSVMAELGMPDMRTPIAYALAWPKRITSGVKQLNLLEIGKLEFFPVDFQQFPCMKLCYEALAAGGTATVTLNAANEIAVAAFLENRIKFIQIAEVVQTALETVAIQPANNLEAILAIDAETRRISQKTIDML
jgi:1-deoxy-D-xylulose-5-phosphate reductoisomerase